MLLALITSLAVCLWIFMWAVGVAPIDGLLLAVTIVVVAGGIAGLKHFLPNADRQ